MKIVKLGFLSILITFLFICSDAQEISQKTDSSPLKLSLRIEEKELCVGKEFKILARMENISNTNQIIDKRNVWRYSNVRAQGKEVSYDQKKSFAENLTESLKQYRYQVAMGDSFPDDDVPTEYFITLKPKEFYENSIVIKADDKFFNKPDKYIYQSGYGQYSDWSAKGFSLFIGHIDSDELKFTLLDCKVN